MFYETFLTLIYPSSTGYRLRLTTFSNNTRQIIFANAGQPRLLGLKLVLFEPRFDNLGSRIASISQKGLEPAVTEC
jgi:hypothetical protein